MTRLQTLLTQRMEFARAVVTAREASQDAEIRRLLAADAGNEGSREIARTIEKLKDAQKALLTERDKTAFLQAQTTRWTVLGGVAINFLLLAGAAWLIRDDIAARKRAAAILEEANATLEAKVKERTAELVAANEKLVAENQERKWGAQALEHQLRYNQLIINSISDLVVVLSKVCNITRVNPAVAQWTGWQAAEIISKPLARITRVKPPGGGEAPGAADPVSVALKAGRELHEQRAEILTQDGRAIPGYLSMFPLRDRDKVVGAVVTIRVADRPADPTGPNQPQHA
jgi:PAS domain S-box-containing protein